MCRAQPENGDGLVGGAVLNCCPAAPRDQDKRRAPI
jgi:hypothetical protein